jgi:tripartite-type tricarboxylate transporter receptor subunit TctC
MALADANSANKDQNTKYHQGGSHMQLFITAALTLLLALSPFQARAETYPSRPIKLVLPFGAGSASDALARMVGTELSKLMGQTIVVAP